ncbi:hypothetical protein Hanom_Chr07g00601851 [Helianthus anomalus]
MGWINKLNGSIARLGKMFKDMDEFNQEVIDEHLNKKQPNKLKSKMMWLISCLNLSKIMEMISLLIM